VNFYKAHPLISLFLVLIVLCLLLGILCLEQQHLTVLCQKGNCSFLADNQGSQERPAYRGLSEVIAVSGELHTAPGPVLLLAAPGTGKTYQLALRMKHLVEGRSIPPEEITVITFTRAAAREMRSRISNPEEEKLYIPPELQPHNICTMHSLGYSIINSKPSNLGLSIPINVVDPDRSGKLLLKDAAQLIGLQRSEAEATAICRRDGECQPSNEDKCRICECYKALLRACNAIDYNDQILLACELLEDDSLTSIKISTRPSFG